MTNKEAFHLHICLEFVDEFITKNKELTKSAPKTDHELAVLRKKLVEEEFDEYLDALVSKPLAEVAKEAIDLIYVALGGFIEVDGQIKNEETKFDFKYNRTPEYFSNMALFAIREFPRLNMKKFMICFETVHANNMLKFIDPIWNNTGKLIKKPDHPKVDLSKVIL